MARINRLRVSPPPFAEDDVCALVYGVLPQHNNNTSFWVKLDMVRLVCLLQYCCVVSVLCFQTGPRVCSNTGLRSTTSAIEKESALVELHPGKAAFLIGKWKTALENDISLGFLPQHTHPNRNVSRLMRSSKYFKDVYAMCSALAMSADGKTNVVGTPRSKHGAAIALVRENSETVDIVHMVVNPDSRDDSAICASEIEIADAIRQQNAQKLVRISSAARLNLVATDTQLDLASDAPESSENEPSDSWLTFSEIPSLSS